MTKIYEKLLKLGEVSRNAEWPDYLQLGISSKDVPELQTMLANKALHHAPQESNEVWVPLHAWRALGQLKSLESVELILSLLDEILVNDDWAMTEIPIVFGLIGTAAIDALNRYLHEQDHDEFSRVMAANGIKQIASLNPEYYPQCVALLTAYINKPDGSATALNACVVGDLIDLEAKESIETIRKLYHNGLVDICMQGDLEDVEIELGLRDKRDTPKPHYGKLAAKKKIEKPDPDSPNYIYKQLNYYLAEYGSENAIENVSELDGYLAAIVSAPSVIMPSQWMPVLWGGEDHMPEWPDLDTYQDFVTTLMDYNNFVVSSLIEEDYEPLFMEGRFEDITITLPNDWCNGYLRGINLWPPLNTVDATLVTNAIQPIKLFVTENGYNQLKTMSDKKIEELHQEISINAQEIHQHFIIQRSQFEKPVRVEKTGRNDPCPCGSGKKYKKCCLH